MKKRSLPCIPLFCLAAATAGAAEPAGQLVPMFDQHCYDCHDSDAKKGGLDLTALKWQPDDIENLQQWTKVFDKVERGEMPPKKKPRPAEELSQAFLKALGGELHEHSRRRQEATTSPRDWESQIAFTSSTGTDDVTFATTVRSTSSSSASTSLASRVSTSWDPGRVSAGARPTEPAAAFFLRGARCLAMPEVYRRRPPSTRSRCAGPSDERMMRPAGNRPRNRSGRRGSRR